MNTLLYLSLVHLTIEPKLGHVLDFKERPSFLS